MKSMTQAATARVEVSFFVALARAFAGAVLFGLPLFMTMEMWWLGFTTEPHRLALFILVGASVLWPLAWLAGFREDASWFDSLVDAGVAYLVAVIASSFVLLLLGVIKTGMSSYEILGKIAVQSVPGAIGALLARSQLGMQGEDDTSERRREAYPSELFLMAIGALFFAFNVAPTEEIVLIAHLQASPWYLLAVMAVALAVMHAFVYGVGFHGQHAAGAGKSGPVEFLTLTVPGYVLVLVVCGYVLWTFGRFDGAAPDFARDLILVLALPGAIGAASARLVL
jgi:putative integral membrane protein (TIGR02587 family)